MSPAVARSCLALFHKTVEKHCSFTTHFGKELRNIEDEKGEEELRTEN